MYSRITNPSQPAPAIPSPAPSQLTTTVPRCLQTTYVAGTEFGVSVTENVEALLIDLDCADFAALGASE